MDLRSRASTSLPVPVGQVLDGKYRIEGMLGMGGMAVVAVATHLHLDQRVAIKFMLPSAIPERRVERFLREVRSLASLRSQHIVRVFDVGMRAPDAPYLVMELLEGRDLKTVVREEGPLPVGQAAEYVIQICEGIAEAHARGIVHRDLKPRNLLLTYSVDGTPLIKILDFGISKQTNSSEATITGFCQVLGTPSHIAPEGLELGARVDTRTDIWSLGVVLYELLTGHLPFRGGSQADLLEMVRTATPVPPHVVRPSVPEEVSAIVMRCLAKSATERFPDVAALAAALEPHAQPTERRRGRRVADVLGVSMPDIPPPPADVPEAVPWRSSMPVGVGLTLVAMAIVLLVGSHPRRAAGGSAPATPMNATIVVPRAAEVDLLPPPVEAVPVPVQPLQATPAPRVARARRER